MKAKYTVLILDDENVLADILEANITRLYDGHTFHVINESDGIRALKIIADSEIHIDVLITDLMHPGVSGIDLIRTVREKFTNVKIIVQTGFGDREILDQCRVYADTVLKKPFKIIELTNAIQNLLPAK
jgi:DNA-binding response OmpR family regulator